MYHCNAASNSLVYTNTFAFRWKHADKNDNIFCAVFLHSQFFRATLNFISLENFLAAILILNFEKLSISWERFLANFHFKYSQKLNIKL